MELAHPSIDVRLRGNAASARLASQKDQQTLATYVLTRLTSSAVFV